jgi:Flp pilus assembly protein TadG
MIARPRGAQITTGDPRGQTLAEFALILPILLVILLGVVDFGRVFSAGITMEAAARNAAEAAAQEYQQIIRNTPAPSAADYQRIHDVALDELCSEAKVLPNVVALDADGDPSTPEVCTMPVTAACTHDQSGGDPLCGQASGAVPSECTALDGWAAAANPSNVAPVPAGLTAVPYVEVRACYHFTTLFNLHFQLPFGASLSLGDIWMQRDRTFVVGDY